MLIRKIQNLLNLKKNILKSINNLENYIDVLETK